MSLSEELKWRGFVNQTTFKSNSDIDGSPIKFYWGVDPSAPSMTIGNLASAMMVRHFIRHGHKAVMLVGGATGMIGDPDGKSEERDLKTIEELDKNKKGIIDQYKIIFGEGEFETVDNLDWFKNINYLDFLRNVGKHVPMRQMLGRDFVQKRLSESGSGISYAEFSYVLIQAYDFYYLNKNHNVRLQLCGSDQWGNSIAGVDLIRRMSGNETHVWSTPLIINKTTGAKFGKTEDGAVWLDEKKTSVYKFYQFWLNVDDEGVEDYLKIYTLLSKKEIEEILAKFRQNPGNRLAQKTLAYEVTKLVHGKDRAEDQQKIAGVLFETRDFHGFAASDFITLEKELPFAIVEEGGSYLDALVATGLASSKGEARRLVEDGAVSANKFYVINPSELEIKNGDFLSGYSVIFKGKKHIGLLKIK